MTTILALRKDKKVVLAGDGQVSIGQTVLKGSARKVRVIHQGKVLCGFAGSTADAVTLFEKLEAKLNAHGGNLLRGAVELAREWRSDKYLRRLEALMVVASREHLLVISGSGDVIEPDEGIAAIGSGGNYALAAARALYRRSDLGAREIVETSMKIASEICVYTNNHLTLEELSL